MKLWMPITNCKPFLPGFFDCTPHNPSLYKKLWYKCTEYITWIYDLCPALLYDILPPNTWHNVSKFITGLCIISQYSITSFQLQQLHKLFIQGKTEYKLLFYQHQTNQIHFVSFCVHLTSHLTTNAACKAYMQVACTLVQLHM